MPTETADVKARLEPAATRADHDEGRRGAAARCLI
jgi:hypothetical protein